MRTQRLAPFDCLLVSIAVPNSHTVFLQLLHREASSEGWQLVGRASYLTSVAHPGESLVQKLLMCVLTLCAVQPMRPPILWYGTECSKVRSGKCVIFIFFQWSYSCEIQIVFIRSGSKYRCGWCIIKEKKNG